MYVVVREPGDGGVDGDEMGEVVMGSCWVQGVWGFHLMLARLLLTKQPNTRENILHGYANVCMCEDGTSVPAEGRGWYVKDPFLAGDLAGSGNGEDGRC